MQKTASMEHNDQLWQKNGWTYEQLLKIWHFKLFSNEKL